MFVYNKRLVPADEVPNTHAEFAKLIASKHDKYQGKVTTYDIEKAGVGFTFITHDLKESPQFWDFAKTLGNAGLRVQSSTGTMLERISSGENLIGYNMLGSYALARAKKDPSIGIVYPKDYSLVLSRVMFINKSAKNMNAAKLWLDYVLSKRGQTVIANDAKLYSIRADVTGETTSAELTQLLGKLAAADDGRSRPAAIPGPGQAPGIPEAVERSHQQKVRVSAGPGSVPDAPAIPARRRPAVGRRRWRTITESRRPCKPYLFPAPRRRAGCRYRASWRA